MESTSNLGFNRTIRPSESVTLSKRSIPKRKISLTVKERNTLLKPKHNEYEGKIKLKSFMSTSVKKESKCFRDTLKIRSFLKENMVL